jgi:hypothetical protein
MSAPNEQTPRASRWWLRLRSEDHEPAYACDVAAYRRSFWLGFRPVKWGPRTHGHINRHRQTRREDTNTRRRFTANHGVLLSPTITDEVRLVSSVITDSLHVWCINDNVKTFGYYGASNAFFFFFFILKFTICINKTQWVNEIICTTQYNIKTEWQDKGDHPVIEPFRFKLI